MSRDQTLIETVPEVPYGYTLRQFEAGDDLEYLELFSVGFGDRSNLEETRRCALDGGFFVVEHEATGMLVASCIAGEGPPHVEQNRGRSWLGWLVADPAHTRKGLATAVVANVTNVLIERGRYPLSLGTEDERLAAISIYLKLGWEPDLYAPCMDERWEAIRGRLWASP